MLNSFMYWEIFNASFSNKKIIWYLFAFNYIVLFENHHNYITYFSYKFVFLQPCNIYCGRRSTSNTGTESIIGYSTFETKLSLSF